MNVLLIDIICVVFMAFMIIIGYRKGFVTRLYDICSLIIVFVLAYFLAKPLSSIWTVYSYDTSWSLAALMGSMINQFIIFLILLIILFIVKKVIGIFLKPMLKNITHVFSLTAFFDSLLGAILSAVESLAIIYIVLVFIYIPLTSQGQQQVKESFIANRIVSLTPSLSQNIMDISELFHHDSSSETSHSLETLTQMTLLAREMNVIDSSQAITILEDHVFSKLNDATLVFNEEQKEKLQSLLQEMGYSSLDIHNILSQ